MLTRQLVSAGDQALKNAPSGKHWAHFGALWSIVEHLECYEISSMPRIFHAGYRPILVKFSGLF
jgi:hypothetical protein